MGSVKSFCQTEKSSRHESLRQTKTRSIPKRKNSPKIQNTPRLSFYSNTGDEDQYLPVEMRRNEARRSLSGPHDKKNKITGVEIHKRPEPNCFLGGKTYTTIAQRIAPDHSWAISSMLWPNPTGAFTTQHACPPPRQLVRTTQQVVPRSRTLLSPDRNRLICTRPSSTVVTSAPKPAQSAVAVRSTTHRPRGQNLDCALGLSVVWPSEGKSAEVGSVGTTLSDVLSLVWEELYVYECPQKKKNRIATPTTALHTGIFAFGLRAA